MGDELASAHYLQVVVLMVLEIMFVKTVLCNELLLDQVQQILILITTTTTDFSESSISVETFFSDSVPSNSSQINIPLITGATVGSVAGVSLLGTCCHFFIRGCRQRADQRKRERQQEQQQEIERERRRQENIGLQNIDLRGEVQNLKTQKARQDAELNRLGQRIQDLTQINQGQNETIQDNNAVITELVKKEQKKDVEMQRLITRLQELEEIQRRIQTLEPLQNQLQNVEDQRTRQESEINLLERTIQELVEEMDKQVEEARVDEANIHLEALDIAKK